MKRSLRYLTGIAALLAASSASAKDLPNYNAYYEAKPVAPVLTPSARVLASGFASSMDTQRGVPAFFWAAGAPSLFQAPQVALGTAEAAARLYLQKYASVYGVSDKALDTAVVTQTHDLGHGGIIVSMRQVVDGIELYRNDVKVLMRRNHELVAISGSLHPSAVSGMTRSSTKFTVSAEKALAFALSDLYAMKVSPSSILDIKTVKADYRYFDLLSTPDIKAAKLHFSEPARVKKIYFPMPDRLIPAYFVEFLAGDVTSTDADAYDYVIAADDGRVLYRANLTESAAFNYRVWADSAATGGRPFDGPIVDFTPHPAGKPDGTFPAFAAPNLVTMDGFNKNPNNTFDPWMVAGATVTTGNNVDAYTDVFAPDGFTVGKDLRADVTAPGAFDRTYDLTLDPVPGGVQNQNQGKAALADIFYVCNWLDNWWYDSGFNEASGVGHQDNYGRGGVAGDPLHAEGEDSAVGPPAQSNNANMAAMADGTSPRMQMYLWDGKAQANLTANPGNQSYVNGSAAFGPAAFSQMAGLILAADGVGPDVNDLCQPVSNNVMGKIALINRGTCSFASKAAAAEAGGALGVIIVDNVASATPPAMGQAQPPITVNIPAMSMTQADGATLKAALLNGAVTITMSRSLAVRVDGTIDNSVVAHEWGHYLHHRLENCSSLMCRGESEGWADFDALEMILRPGDNLDGTFALAIYAAVALGDAGYFGIRRFPYSVDMNRNPETFKDISDGQALPNNAPMSGNGAPNNSEVHNSGEIWATMMFESYVALLKNTQGANPPYDFQQARRRMSDYIVAGMKISPTDPTITEQRDAVLAAALAADPKDFALIAPAFAKRGAGTCAVSPPRASLDLVGVTEDFGLKPEVSIVSVKVDDSVLSCDSDGILDAQEKGKVTITIKNTGTAPLMNTTAIVSSGLAGVSFPNGAQATFGVIAPFATGSAFVEIDLDNTIQSIASLDLKVDVTDPDACTNKQTTSSTTKINYDNTPNSSATDDVESESPVWTAVSASGPADIWSRQLAKPPNHVWVGVDFGSPSDASLVSPPLNVAAAQNFVLTFKYRHQFEQDATANWDGAVIEVSTDNGVNWTDASTFGAIAAYTGTIGDPANMAVNALKGRKGFVGQSPSWPGQDTATINLGSGLAGKTVEVRFRVGSDDAGGAYGLELDDIGFQGITNKPFPTITPNAGCSNLPPVADAGQDQTVFGGDLVTLDGSKSSDPKNLPLTYAWSDLNMPMVMLAATTSVKSTFTAPTVAMDTPLTFQLSVNDGKGMASAMTHVLVKPGKASSSSGSGSVSGSGSGGVGGSGAGGNGMSSSTGGGPVEVGGCGCSTVGSSSAATASPLLAFALLALRRRRRASADRSRS